MHVKDKVEVVGFAPAHHAVDAGEAVLIGGEAHVVFISEELIMEGETDCIGTCGRDIVDVGLGDIVIFELCPEFCRLVGTHEMTHDIIDLSGSIHASEAKHIAFGIEPVAEIRAYDEELGAVGLDEIGSVDLHKFRSLLLGGRFVGTARYSGSREKSSGSADDGG